MAAVLIVADELEIEACMTASSHFLEEKKAVMGPPFLQPVRRSLEETILHDVFFHRGRLALKIIEDASSCPVASVAGLYQPAQADHLENILLLHGDVRPGRDVKKSSLHHTPAAGREGGSNPIRIDIIQLIIAGIMRTQYPANILFVGYTDKERLLGDAGKLDQILFAILDMPQGGEVPRHVKRTVSKRKNGRSRRLAEEIGGETGLSPYLLNRLQPCRRLVDNGDFRPLRSPPDTVDPGHTRHSEGGSLQHGVHIVSGLQPAKIMMQDKALVSSAKSLIRLYKILFPAVGDCYHPRFGH